MTNGASFGAANILLQSTLPHLGYTRQAFIVSPTYFLINSVFLDAGFAGKLTAVPEDCEKGIDFDFLERQLVKYDELAAESASVNVDSDANEDPDLIIGDLSRPKRKIYRYVIYLVPTYSNPSGSTMTYDQRIHLINLARKHDMLILCDDVYDLLNYPGSEPTPPRIVTLDRFTLPEPTDDSTPIAGNTISNLTFSKLLGPGLRVGWQESSTPLLAAQNLSQGGAVRSGGTPSQLNTMIVGEMLSLNLVDGIIANLVNVYKSRAVCLEQAVAKYLPKGTKVYGGKGGYFLWVVTPDSLDARLVAANCKRRGVVLANGDNFEVQGDAIGWGITGQRLSISYLSEEEITAGVKIWGQVCTDMLAENGSAPTE